MDKQGLEGVCRRIRELVLGMVRSSGSGHAGGSLSATEILCALYFGVMKHDPANPEWDGRDRLIYSKGHSSLSYYAALALSGYFPVGDLDGFGKNGTLMNHPNMHTTPGVEMSTGSLGQGLSVSVGMALAARMSGQGHRVFCVLGDGECHEGQVWEAAMSAAHFRLGNLTAVVDRNRLCVDGDTEDVMGLEPLADKWRSFGWDVVGVDGHDVCAVREALSVSNGLIGRPRLVLAGTVKGKGLPHGLEGMAKCHYITAGDLAGEVVL